MMLVLLFALLGPVNAGSWSEDWMGSLSMAVVTKPFVQLKIPGTHDSFSYSVSPHNDIAPGEPDIVKKLAKLPFAKRIIYNWSVTQGLDVTGQATAGIRYFDVRTSFDPTRNDFYAVHGLYGGRTLGMLAELSKFLDQHAKEVVVVDFNHFYNFNDTTHNQYMAAIQGVFGSKLCQKSMQIQKARLLDFWTQKCQVIAVYQRGNPSSNFWPQGTVESDWPHTDNLTVLFKDLTQFLDDRAESELFVTQALRTESANDIVRHFWSSLKEVFGLPTTKACVARVNGLTPQMKAKVNIVEADFTSHYDFVKTIVDLNN